MPQSEHIYIIGIGGIGISALARMLKHDGYTVSGSDRTASKLTKTLEEEGIEVFYNQKAANISGWIDRVVYTVAIPDDHPELREARQRGIPTATYPEMLGEVSKDKYTIAVAGTHGKTTTTAMIAHILGEAGRDPTVVVGSLVWYTKKSSEHKDESAESRQTNFIPGQSNFFVVEACEYKRSFLQLYPTILVITNIEEEHLDYYRDLADIQSAFRKLAMRVPKSGAVVTLPRDPNIAPILDGVPAPIVDYDAVDLPSLQLPVPGSHNRANAKAAVAASEFAGVSRDEASRLLNTFRGSWRRLEYRGEHQSSALLYDDYAHHPTEIKASLSALREMFPDRTLRVIFQPHLFSRTKQFLGEIAESLRVADDIVLAPIYAAREQPDSQVDHYTLADEVRKHKATSVQARDSLEQIASYIEDTAGAGDIVVTMGAGDIDSLHDLLTGSPALRGVETVQP